MSSRQASISNFSVKGSPTWTAGRSSSDLASNSREARRLAPWMPSRPVREPTYITGLPTPAARARKILSVRTVPKVNAFTKMLPL